MSKRRTPVVLTGYQGVTQLRILDGGKHPICGVRLRFVGEVDAGDETLQEAAGEDGYHDVGGLGASAGTGDGTRFNGHEREFAAFHRVRASEARERFGIEREIPPFVGGVVVAARLVGLPDLDHGVGHGLSGAVVDRPLDPYRRRMAGYDELRAILVHKGIVEEGSYGLRGGKLRAHACGLSNGVASRPSRTTSNR